MAKSTSGIHISMLSSAEHALQRGYELLSEGLQKDNPYKVKEAVIWVTQGVELSLKQLLANRISEYLVFEKIDDAVTKIENLRYDSGQEDATSLTLLMKHPSVTTARYNTLLGRVAILLDITELSKGKTLRKDLLEIAKLRNQLVHSYAELDIVPIAKLLTRLGEPFLRVITSELGDNNLTYDAKMSIYHAITMASSSVNGYKPRQSDTVSRILTLLQRFRSQKVPGNLLSKDGVFTLPDFSKAEVRREAGYNNYRIISTETSWLVWITDGYANKEAMVVKEQLALRLGVDRLWVAGASTYPYVYPNVLISSEQDVNQLEKLLLSDSDS
jgi:hypothetical protein